MKLEPGLLCMYNGALFSIYCSIFNDFLSSLVLGGTLLMPWNVDNSGAVAIDMT